MEKKYRIELSVEERQELKQWCREGGRRPTGRPMLAFCC